MVTSLLDCLAALAWCAVLLVALAGWGALTLRLIAFRQQGMAMCAAAGLGFACLIGGALNLAHWVTRGNLLSGIAVGAVLWFVQWIGASQPQHVDQRQAEKASRNARIIFLLLALMLGLRLAASVRTANYQASDDLTSYLAVPKKMLQRHGMDADPFSERRVVSAAGPGYFLQTLVLAERPLENLQMADRTLGLLLAVGLCWQLGGRLGISRKDAAVVALLAASTPFMFFNLTYAELPFAIYLAMAILAAGMPAQPQLRMLLIGALAGVVSGLKSTNVPAAVVFCLFVPWLAVPQRKAVEILRAWLLAGAGMAGVLALWMLAWHRQEGTWFYPILGRGFDYSAYHLVPKPSSLGSSRQTLKIVLSAAPLVVLLAWQAIALLRGKVRSAAFAASTALTGACLAGTLAVGVGTGGESIRRYCYPCIAATLIFFVVASLSELRSHPVDKQHAQSLRMMNLAATALAALFAVSVWFNGFTQEWKATLHNLSLDLHPYAITPPYEAVRYARLEAAMPRDAAVLATLRLPFLLDFTDRQILMADIPAAAGPPPGWPVFSSGEALAGYLRANGIRYLAYSYGDCGTMVDSINAVEQYDHGQSIWVRTQEGLALRAHAQYRYLATNYQRLFDDGSLYLVDLRRPLARPSPPVSNAPCTSP